MQVMHAVLAFGLLQGALAAFGRIPNMDLTVHDLVGDLVNNTIDNGNIAISSLSSVASVPTASIASLQHSYMEVPDGDDTAASETSSHGLLDPDQSAFTTVTLTSRLNSSVANTATTLPVSSVSSTHNHANLGPDHKEHSTSWDGCGDKMNSATTSASTLSAVPSTIPSFSTIIATSSTTPISLTTTQMGMDKIKSLDKDKVAMNVEVGATTAIQRIVQEVANNNIASEKSDKILKAKKDAGLVECNMTCDSEALHKECTNLPYFAQCILGSSFGACGRLVMVEAHEPCFIHCSCVVGQHGDQTQQVDGNHNEFEGLD